MKLTYKPGKLHKIHIYVDDEYRLTVDDEYWFSEKWHNLKEIDDGEAGCFGRSGQLSPRL